MSGEFSVWDPKVFRFTFEGGKVVEVAPLKARDFARVQVLAPGVLEMIDPGRLHELYGIGHDKVVEFLAVTTGEPAAWLHDQDTDRLMEMLGASLTVNTDFSRRRVAPALERMVGQALAAVNGEAPTGASSSPDSDSSDTEETTSST